jgi:outer membrane murein-binding lipoprotein Lpp
MAIAGLTVLAGTSLGGCVTTDYVDERIAAVNQRIDALEARVGQVDQTAQAAASSAQQANQRIDALSARVDGLEQRMMKPPRH